MDPLNGTIRNTLMPIDIGAARNVPSDASYLLDGMLKNVKFTFGEGKYSNADYVTETSIFNAANKDRVGNKIGQSITLRQVDIPIKNVTTDVLLVVLLHGKVIRREVIKYASFASTNVIHVKNLSAEKHTIMLTDTHENHSYIAAVY
jgi:hypothetical protein